MVARRSDDYLTKPFDVKELSARIRALLRRGEVKTSNTLQVGNIVLDPVKHRVTVSGEEIKLAPREFAFLEFLMRHPDKVFSAEALIKRVFSSDSDMTPDAVRTYIMRLRKKIDRGQTETVETIERVGYRLRMPQE